MINIPKGEMCMACVSLHSKCNHLPFDSYRPMGKVDDEGYRQVKCEHFKKQEATIDNNNLIKTRSN